MQILFFLISWVVSGKVGLKDEPPDSSGTIVRIEWQTGDVAGIGFDTTDIHGGFSFDSVETDTYDFYFKNTAYYPDSMMDVYISEDKIFTLMRKFKRKSQLFKDTGGVHSAALCKQEEIILFAEDIGRHNALDKIIGESLQEGIPLEDKIILSSGRMTSEIVTKLAKQRTPILISKAAPTDLGIQIAQEIGMTLVGFVRGKRMNIYSHNWRIKK